MKYHFVKRSSLVTSLCMSTCLLTSCGEEPVDELKCSLFVIINETNEWPIRVDVSEYEDDSVFTLGLNLYDYLFYGAQHCAVESYPSPEDVFDQIDAYIQNDSGDVLVHSGVGNNDWLASPDVFENKNVMRYSIAFDSYGVTLVHTITP